MPEIITTERISLGARARDWTEAVRASAQLLQRDGSITQQYVDAIFESFAVNGGYMIVVPGVVLAHARPERGAVRTALSVLTLREPVLYDDAAAQQLSVVLTFAAVDDTEHVALLQGLARVLVDSGALELLKTTDDVDAVMSLLAVAGK
jgi:PTS system ascorbate-specific IIA component